MGPITIAKLSQARRLIDIGAEARVDAVKFQTYSADALFLRRRRYFLASKQSPMTNKTSRISAKMASELAEYGRSQNLIFLTSPLIIKRSTNSPRSEVEAYKWASSEITDLPNVKDAA